MLFRSVRAERADDPLKPERSVLSGSVPNPMTNASATAAPVATFERRARAWLKPVVFWLLAAPLLWLFWQWAMLFAGRANVLGFNPIEYTHRFLGDTAIRVLLLSLAITPLRAITGWGPLLRVRRRIGLFAFGYALLHVAAYLGLDLVFSLSALWEDVVKRRYITLGMAAFALLIPLAATSHDAMIKRLGALRWRRLHSLVYPLAVIAVAHHALMVKGNQVGPWVHGGLLALLLGWRLARWTRRARRPA